MSKRSALSSCIFEATYRFTFVAACNFAVGNSRPLITQTPLPRTTKMNGQFLGWDFNPLDKQLLLRTDMILIYSCSLEIGMLSPHLIRYCAILEFVF